MKLNTAAVESTAIHLIHEAKTNDWKTDVQKSIYFLLNPFFVFRNDLYVNLMHYIYVHMLLNKNEIKV